MILLFLLFPFRAFSSIDTEVGIYSDFIWRGTTFSENRPSIQAEMEKEFAHGLYVGTFLANAEFEDEALHENAKVTSEIDATIGKRWGNESWEIQLYYARFFFPNAGVFDTDEFNLQGKWKGFSVELSFMDDYFGYHSRYYYARAGYHWFYKPNVDGGLFVGYNSFDRAKGSIRTRDTFETLDGAGNPDYIDLYFINRKTFTDDETAVELAFNWTNRKEYSVDGGEISKDPAKDFAVVVAYIIPFTL